MTVFGFCDASGAYAYMHVIVQLVYLLVVVQSKHSVVEAEQNLNLKEGQKSIILKMDIFVNEFYSRMTQSKTSQSGGSKTPFG